MKTLLKNAVLLDANYSGEALDVLVDGRTIAAIGTELSGADEVIDLSGCTLLPGFIDAHVHVAMKDDHFTDVALLAWAQNGVTTVREPGMLCTLQQDAYAAWIGEQNKRPETARLVATGKYIDIAGGYGAGPDPNRAVGNIVETIEEAEAAVQQAHDLGFPGTKIGIQDGMPGNPRMSNEMIAAITAKAASLGMFTLCHIGKSASLEDMVNNGIGEAGHTPGDRMSDDLIAAMAQKGIPMITTIGDPDKSPEPPDMEELMKMMGGPGGPGGPGGMPGGPMGGPGGMPGGPMGGPGGMPGGPGGPGNMSSEAKKEQNRIMKENCRRLYDAGGKVVIGTDLMRSRDFSKDAVIPTTELRQLCEAGIPFTEAIKAGTIYGAEVCGTADEEGTIEVGKLANLIAVPGTVDESFTALDSVPFVMHYGRIIKDVR